MYHHSSDSSTSLPASGCLADDGTELTDVVFTGKAQEYGPGPHGDGYVLPERWSLTDPGCVNTTFTRGQSPEDDMIFDQG